MRPLNSLINVDFTGYYCPVVVLHTVLNSDRVDYGLPENAIPETKQ